jgi:XTP/dITP diphosphohydrolase
MICPRSLANRYAPVDIRFISRNEFKLKEAADILARADVRVIPLKISIDELQTQDMELLVKDKTLRAFREVGRPLFVEQTGLYLQHLNGLPGGLTQSFWDTLKAEKFSSLFGSVHDPGVIARTVIGYTDGKKFLSFRGEIAGTISSTPRGSREFQWDCVFVPEETNQTFAEMGEQKNEISMRRRALDEFARYLVERGLP